MQVNNVSSNYFFKFPIKMVFDGRWSKLSDPARSVFGVLGAQANWKTGESRLALDTIANEAGFCRRTAIYAVQELEQLKVVLVKRTQGYVNHYVLAHYIAAHTPDDGGGGDTGTGIPEEDNAQQELHFDENALADTTADCEPEGNLQPEPETQQEQEPETKADVEPTETIEETMSLQQPTEDDVQVEPEPQEQEDEPEQEVEEVSEPEPEDDDDDGAQDNTLNEREASDEDTLNTDEVQDYAPTSEPDCTTPCTTMHHPVQPHAPKQENKKPDRISDNNSTAPKSEEWYRSLSTESQSSVLCCTRAISNVFAVTFGKKYVPSPIIMEKLMEGYKPQFLMDIIRHANVPQILNPIGWFRSIRADWHIKGEPEEEYWRRLANFGINASPILVSDEIIEQNPELADEMEDMVPKAMQVYQLAVRYNRTLDDLNMLEGLAKEGDKDGKDTTGTWKNYEEVLKQIDRILAGMEAFSYHYTEVEREKGFDMKALKTELKTWES